MPALLTTASTLMCPHGGPVQIVSSNTRTQTGGAFAALSTDTFVIAGCAFMIGPAPSPCVQVMWVQPAARVGSSGRPRSPKKASASALQRPARSRGR